jgi:hypothetical protein
MPTKRTAVSRRAFVRATAGTLVGLNIVPRRAVAGSGQTPPSERVQVAAIGCAGRPDTNIRGLADCGAEIVGLCDVDTRRTDKIRQRFESAPFFKDYR